MEKGIAELADSSTTHTTSPGSSFTMENLNKLLDSLETVEVNALAKEIRHFDCQKFFSQFPRGPKIPQGLTHLYGVPIYKDESVPPGEIHIIGTDGKVMKKLIYIKHG